MTPDPEVERDLIGLMLTNASSLTARGLISYRAVDLIDKYYGPGNGPAGVQLTGAPRVVVHGTTRP